MARSFTGFRVAGTAGMKETVTVIFYIYKSHLFIWLFHMEIYRASLLTHLESGRTVSLQARTQNVLSGIP
ncbi:hypothetical protein, partial [Pseudomonas viridiflava]|uniref:hypothetical protein n=1 Tax=Pseudomonas viridiflava TaxID=33069 RepID=UPI001E4C9ACC